MGMDEISDRSIATLKALEKVGSIDLDVLLSRADEVRSVTTHPHFGDVVSVAAEVQRLGFATERVQQR
jgi:hypothetical protein